MTENTSNQEFLESIVQELMADETWELPPQCRFFLVADLAWALLGI